MTILLLAPHPFYQERGTPIAVDLLLRVLSQAGHTIHLLTFHEGEDRTYPGVTLHRISAPGFIRNVPPGFSGKKLLCDALFALKLPGLIRRTRPDIVHAVEEAAILAMMARWCFRVPYLYDMDSSLPAQLVESRPWMKPFAPLFRWIERRTIRQARAVIPVCQSLADIATAQGAAQVALLPDISQLDPAGAAPGAAAELAALPGCRFLYVGNLERYQGIDLLLESFAIAASQETSLSLAIVGGTPEKIDACRTRTIALHIAGKVTFFGPRPLSDLAAWLDAADVLVSPRIRGTNTPMKIYPYLHSGTPVLATHLETHTQVLTDDIAILADPTPVLFGDAMAALARDPERRGHIGTRAQAHAEQHHTYPAFETTLLTLYRSLEDEPS